LADSDLVVVTAGFPRKPGMSRSDVLAANVKIIDEVTDHIVEHAPDAIVLVVSNPVDTLTYRVAQRTGWPRSRVFGQAGVLDASRMAAFIAEETGFSALDITTIVLGGHGDTMVPMPRYCTVNGVPVSNFIAPDRLEAIIERTRKGGAEILALRKNSSAYDAPAAAVAAMVDAISNNRRRLMPCVALLEGEYGKRDIAMGVPCVLDERGLSEVVELELDERERADFERSSAAVHEDIERLASIV
jgi:malate dehydrogenase